MSKSCGKSEGSQFGVITVCGKRGWQCDACKLVDANTKLALAEKLLQKVRDTAHGCCVCDEAWGYAEAYFDPFLKEELEKGGKL